MERDIIKIDEEKCNGCGLCVPNCHEGALQIIDGKVRLVSDLMCDGLGACIGHCPEGAIEIERREAEPYDEVKVMEIMVTKGINTVAAHLKHLKEHNETEFLRQGMEYLVENEDKLDFTVEQVRKTIHGVAVEAEPEPEACGGGCPGSQPVAFAPMANEKISVAGIADVKSELSQWPLQLHLVNPMAQYFVDSDLLVAADCTAFSIGNFHQKWLKGRSLIIACPKLDNGQEIYLRKLVSLIEDANVNTITVLIMEVPCCGGLLQLVEMAVQQAKRKVPVKGVTVGIRGDILHEEWA